MMNYDCFTGIPYIKTLRICLTDCLGPDYTIIWKNSTGTFDVDTLNLDSELNILYGTQFVNNTNINYVVINEQKEKQFWITVLYTIQYYNDNYRYTIHTL